MNFFSAVLLGILQGLTEFLPVSSSGHLVLAQHFFGVETGGDILFEVFLHLGTLLAVMIFFRKKLWSLLVSLLNWKNTLRHQAHRHNRTLVLYLIVASIVTASMYLIFGDVFESLYGKPLVVAFMLILTGSIIFFSDKVRSGGVPASQMGLIRGIIIGFVQGLAIIPGISRSGSTISAALFSGVKRRDAAEFSFLLSIPAILGANLVSLVKFQELGASQLGVYLGGFLAAFIAGYLVIAILIRLIVNARLKYFSFYCWALALSSIILILGGK
ncbi:MAG: undecaprenyl-diphosphate phosphatase [Candidatus Syntrophosphaera sp.]|nr:undecaprenyl-diphosphate phosphatase [Candidatus Syntrophosphaera sp.]